MITFVRIFFFLKEGGREGRERGGAGREGERESNSIMNV